jgi:hypothetical protein
MPTEGSSAKISAGVQSASDVVIRPVPAPISRTLRWTPASSGGSAQRIYGPDHRETAICLGNLASTFSALGGTPRLLLYSSEYSNHALNQGDLRSATAAAGQSFRLVSGLICNDSSPS